MTRPAIFAPHRPKKSQRHFKLTLAYDGTEFVGWQRQTAQRTVQGEMELAWFKTTGEEVAVVASGRTDAGVHALAQVASVDSETEIVPKRLWRALNSYLPDDVRVLEVIEAPCYFHAIRDSVRKRYRYVIQEGLDHDVFGRRYAWTIRRKLNTDAMREAGQRLVGKHDFTSFESMGSQRLTPIRTIYEVQVERRQTETAHLINIEVEADGFLYSMVRNIAGTLVAVGQGRESVDWVTDVLEALDRRRAGMAAPAHGLYLVRVDLEWPSAEMLARRKRRVVKDRVDEGVE